MASPPASIAERLQGLLARAMAAREAGDWTASAMACEQVLAMERDNELAWVLLCNALLKMGSVDADRALADALAALPQDSSARPILTVDRARVLAERGRWDEALAHVRLAQNYPLSARQHDIIGSTLTILGQFEEALSHLEKAVAADPKSPLHHYNHATALRYLGRLDEAEAGYNRTMAIDPLMSLNYASLAALRTWTPQNNHIAALEAALSKTPPDSLEAGRLHHSLFKELHDLARHDDAWSHLARGAAITAKVYSFDAQEREQRVESLITHYPKARFDAAAPSQSGPRPIFVFGLPRSGTTLTERVLAAHSQVRALGETPCFLAAHESGAGLHRATAIDASQVAPMAAADFQGVAALYLKMLGPWIGDAPNFTDKLPQNYELVGSMRLAFPNAGLVHVRRAPMDSLFGAHKLLFGEGGYHWSYRFEDLAANYRAYRRLMAHWRDVLGAALFEITLERLIEDPDTEIRRLLSACGLPFEEACLSPHEAKGGVSTASSTQIRKPINNQGVGAWRRYATQLEPLRAMLEADGFVDRNGDPIWD
jgi:tetratricopeptide (TPR) repeat protein